MSLSIETTIRFVTRAIEGKYHAVDAEIISREVEAAWVRLSNATKLEDLLGARRQILKAEDDINNQVAALLAISNFSNARQFRQGVLTLLHRIVFAAEQAETGRQGARVADFPGDLPIDVSEANARFDELQAAVSAMAQARVHATDIAAPLLAYVFSSVVRIHRYEDGNGRVARFAVQFLLVQWGMDLLPLPKVRNDPDWKVALEGAVHGDLTALTSEFYMRLNQNAELS